MHIKRTLGKRLDKNYVVNIKHQMIWDVMLCRGAAGLYFVPPNSTMNGPKYVELLKEKTKLQMHVHGCTIFMQEWRSLSPIKGSH